MNKILFICHGNICRSPMAEFLFRDLVEKRGIAQEFEIASCATSREEIGNPVYFMAKQKLKEFGIDCSGKTAVQLTRADYRHYDYLLVMEQFNLRNALRILGSDPQGKLLRLLDFTEHPHDIDDPWYTGDFDTACRDILEGCRALLTHLGY